MPTPTVSGGQQSAFYHIEAIVEPIEAVPTFPLYAHALGYWSRKIGGKITHFRRWGRSDKGVVVPVADPDHAWRTAFAAHNFMMSAREAGLRPAIVSPSPSPEPEAELTIASLGKQFLQSKEHKFAAGECGQRMLNEYRGIVELLLSVVGNRHVNTLKPDSFGKLREAMAKRWGPTRLGNSITRVRTIFKLAFNNGLIDRPVRFGSEFEIPGKSVMRRHCAASGEKMLEPDETLSARPSRKCEP